MAKGSGYSGGRGGGSSSGRSGGPRTNGSRGSNSSGGNRSAGSRSGTRSNGSSGGRSLSGQRAANSRMWSQPATAAQIAALKANGNYDGQYYSKGRAGQTIGESVRAAGRGTGSPLAGSTPLTGRPRTADTGQPVPAASISAPRIAEWTDDVVVGEVVDEMPGELAVLSAGRPQGSDPSEAVGILDMALFNDLEERHLRSYQARFGPYNGVGLRHETQVWAEARIELARRITEGRARIAEILRDAPEGTVPDVDSAVGSLLAGASPRGLEERHLRSYQARFGSYNGAGLLREIHQSAEARIKVAATNARGLVELATAHASTKPALPTAQAAPAIEQKDRPDASRRQAQPKRRVASSAEAKAVAPAPRADYMGRVISLNAHGAVLKLDTGDRGWLHVSKLRPLNGGNRVDSVDSLLRVGQDLRVRGIGTTDRSQVRLALASPRKEAAGKHNQEGDELPAEAQPTRSTAGRRGFLSRRLGRSRAAGTDRRSPEPEPHRR